MANYPVDIQRKPLPLRIYSIKTLDQFSQKIITTHSNLEIQMTSHETNFIENYYLMKSLYFIIEHVIT